MSTRKKRLFLVLPILFFLGFLSNLNAQLTQTVRGVIVDNESQYPLIGVNVIVINSTPLIGSVSDEKGRYRLTNVGIGRHSIKLSMIGYKDVILDDIIVTSGKEVVINIKMEESATQMEEVVIVAKKSGEPINEMAVISAREFSVYETEKYAGSRGDPARMAKSYPGVLSSDDSRNDIVVRGNTPLGVLWRLEGINIPNPNHFSIPGTGGGPVTILNNKFLSNSDFFTAAFPAEYSNGIAGVFDLKMRNGNNEKYEGSAQFGFLGTELMLEGPISKKTGASFLTMFKYSTISIFNKLGINVGTDSKPTYQDGAFRLNFPLKKGGNIAIFGIGGKSYVAILKSIQKDTSQLELYGDNDRDQYFGSRMGVVGLSYTKPINKRTFIKAVFSASHQRVTADHDKIVRHVENGKFKVTDTIPILDYKFRDNKYSAYFSFNRKISRKLSYKAGLNFDLYDLKYIDSVRVVTLNEDNTQVAGITPWRIRWKSTGNPMMIQPYFQMKYKANEKLTLTGGITSNIFTLNSNSISPIEPRFGLSYQIDRKQKINIGIGLHSQTLAPYLYYFDKNLDYKRELTPYNTDMGLLKSLHFVLGFEQYLGKRIRFKAETYFQYLFNLPVETTPSSYSLLNSGTGFSRFFPDKLVNKGTGRNYGLDISIEKGFSHGYFFMMSGSLFDAKYRGSDNILRNSSFNGVFATNFLAGKEIKFSKSKTLNLGIKIAWTGGHRHGIIDREASRAAQEVIYSDIDYNEYQFKDYFRTDLKIAYKINTKRFTHEIALDISNLFDTRNILSYSYAPGKINQIQEEHQLGRLPIFYYRFDF